MTDYIYPYSRELVDGAYNINNPHTADLEGVLENLSSCVEAVFPAKTFRMCCCGNVCQFIFTSELTPTEITDLENCVNAHKAL